MATSACSTSVVPPGGGGHPPTGCRRAAVHDDHQHVSRAMHVVPSSACCGGQGDVASDSTVGGDLRSQVQSAVGSLGQPTRRSWSAPEATAAPTARRWTASVRVPRETTGEPGLRYRPGRGGPRRSPTDRPPTGHLPSTSRGRSRRRRSPSDTDPGPPTAVRTSRRDLRGEAVPPRARCTRPRGRPVGYRNAPSGALARRPEAAPPERR